MINFSDLSRYLGAQGTKYIMPEKAGNLKETMNELKREGQAARLAFSQIAKAFQEAYPHFQLDRVSNWANQAQVARPHFWVYLNQGEVWSEPMFAFRLYGNPSEFGISVEVSIIERKRDDQSLQKQAKVVETAAVPGSYYQYLVDDEVVRLPATEANRLYLRAGLESGKIRKVLAKTDIPLTEDLNMADLIEHLYQGMELLKPYYAATRVS